MSKIIGIDLGRISSVESVMKTINYCFNSDEIACIEKGEYFQSKWDDHYTFPVWG